MLRRIGILLIALIAICSFVYVANAQMGEKGSKRTTTLPNGDVIWDLNGEWDVLVEPYGHWSQEASFAQLLKITQKGGSFVGITMTDSPSYPKGEEAIRGELDKNGFKKVETMSDNSRLNSRGTISEDGNKMVIDEGEKYRKTFTRK